MSKACCSEENESSCSSVEQKNRNAEQHDHADHSHDGHNHGSTAEGSWTEKWDLILALCILVVVLVAEYAFEYKLPEPFNLIINLVAYLLAGRDVLKLAFVKAKRGDFFNEFVLMSTATLGAFAIGSYSEGVAVMVFYAIGEWFQEAAVNKAKRSIKALLDVRPDTVFVKTEYGYQSVHPKTVKVGDFIQVKPGEKVGLDGVLYSQNATFNTSALTGESKPDNLKKGEVVLAGMINLNVLADIQVTTLFQDSKLSRILEMVQEATTRKSKTQLFITKFAKVYTPIVFFLALALVVLPYLFVADYIFRDWLYRGLVFLVISCPCALVVSIPLGYFGGIGLASRNGILFKGSNYLDAVTSLQTVVMDKTGTLTKGVFRVQKIVAEAGFDEQLLLKLGAGIESKSTHPIAQAIVEHANLDLNSLNIQSVEEIPGHGLKGIVDGYEVLAGNLKLLQKYQISYSGSINDEQDTIVALSLNGKFAGYIVIADEIKEDAAETISRLKGLGIKTVMLSGDKQSVVERVARKLGIEHYFGNLLPEDKVRHLGDLKSENRKIAFVGDGVNDAPVVALADVGMAMGGLGSYATIEISDVVIQNDDPIKIVYAIEIGKMTRSIVWQNIILAMGVKIAVLALGAGGVASLWEAVIADVGVALLAILNAVRIQRKVIK